MTAPDACRVSLNIGAQQDLRAIVRWIAEHDSLRASEHVLDKILKTCAGLQLQLERGAFPTELLALGIRRYRQFFLPPYRMIYRALDDQVVVMVIADGRRNLKSLLERRLLGA